MTFRSRVIPTIAALGALCASLTVSASPAAAAGVTINDIDGDGRVDIVLVDQYNGLSAETEGYLSRVIVHYGSGRSEKFSREELGLSSDDAIRSSVVVANLNGDGYADLVISCGQHVMLAFGSATGVQRAGVQDLSVSQVSSVAVVPKPTPLIAVGRGAAAASGYAESGLVTLFPVDASGRAGASVTISQNTPGVPGNDEAGDHFGREVAADDTTLVIGTPLEAIGSVKRAGMVTVLHRAGLTSFSGQAFNQNSPGVIGSVSTGDGFGSTLAIEDGFIAVGSPNETVNGLANAGTVQLFTYTPKSVTPARGFSQNSLGIPGSAEASDRFGDGLAFTRPCAGQRALAVGAYGEDHSRGRVTVVNLSSSASCGNKAFGESDVGISPVGNGDMFGWQLVSVRPHASTDSLLVGMMDAWETRYPYTATVRKVSDSDEGLTFVAPMAS